MRKDTLGRSDGGLPSAHAVLAPGWMMQAHWLRRIQLHVSMTWGSGVCRYSFIFLLQVGLHALLASPSQNEQNHGAELLCCQTQELAFELEDMQVSLDNVLAILSKAMGA